MRNRISLLLFIASLVSCCNHLLIAGNREKPNIVYILADDMGPGDVSCYNLNGKIPTPNIDRIANEGMKFMNAHTNSSVCTPTRYGILTGRYAWRTSLKSDVLWGMAPLLIDSSRETVASLLRKNGYKTACVGKWHLGADWQEKPGGGTDDSKYDIHKPIKRGPLDVGFDYFYGLIGSFNMAPHAFVEGREVQGTMEYLATAEDVERRGFIGATTGWAAKEYVQEKVLTTVAEKTCSWIRNNADGPFFMYMPLTSPHNPIIPRKEFIGKSGLSAYADFCMETDWAVGEVLKTLDELNLTNNTLIVFTSDNGTSPAAKFKPMQEKGHFPSWIYRGLKGTLWEGGHRMPFVVRWPKEIKPGSQNEELICTTDLLATCADLMDQKLPDNVSEDGVSFLPALYSKAIPGADTRMVVHHSDKGFFAVRKGKWKLVLHQTGGSRRRNPKDPPIINASDIYLFDMESDVRESTNLVEDFPEVVKSLKDELASIIKNGRSTYGPKQPTDVKTAEWPQIDMVLGGEE